jgi:hypothetical protein
MKEWPPHGRRQTTHISTPASPLRFCLDPAASLRVVGLTAALPLFVRGGCPAQMRARHPRPLLRLIAAPPLVPPNSSARRRSIESSRWSESRNGAASDSKHDPKRGSASRAGAPPPASPHVLTRHDMSGCTFNLPAARHLSCERLTLTLRWCRRVGCVAAFSTASPRLNRPRSKSGTFLPRGRAPPRHLQKVGAPASHGFQASRSPRTFLPFRPGST